MLFFDGGGRNFQILNGFKTFELDKIVHQALTKEFLLISLPMLVESPCPVITAMSSSRV